MLDRNEAFIGAEEDPFDQTEATIESLLANKSGNLESAESIMNILRDDEPTYDFATLSPYQFSLYRKRHKRWGDLMEKAVLANEPQNIYGDQNDGRSLLDRDNDAWF